MQIYFRDEHLIRLEEIFNSSANGSNITLITGKRRVGKTTLVKEHLKRCRGVYISVSIKSSALQLGDISDYLKTFDFTDEFIPGFRNWDEFFQFMFHISRHRPVNLVLDEFHNFEKIEPEFLPSFKKLWDIQSPSSKLNLILISNSESLLQSLFFEVDSPLYGMVKNILHVEPFNFREVLKISRLHGATLKYDEIKKLYLIFGGLPKYYYLINQLDLWKSNLENILRELIFKKFAPLSNEINNLILTEFGRDNKVSLSIMQMLAFDRNSVTDIAEAVGIPVTSTGKYLGELEKKRGVIKRKVPLGTTDPSRSKNGKYFFRSYFHNFWFRFVQSDIISYELEMFEKMLKRVMSELDGYIHNRYPLLLKEIFKQNRSHPEIVRLIGTGDIMMGPLWTRKSYFPLAFLNGQQNELLLCKVVERNVASFDEDVRQLVSDFEEVSKHYLNLRIGLLLVTNAVVNTEKLKHLPQDTKLIKPEMLELLVKADKINVPRGLFSVDSRRTKPVSYKRTVAKKVIEFD